MLILQFFQGIYTFFLNEPAIAGGRVLLIALGFLFVYLSYKHVLEPLIMLPMGIGMLAVNGGLMVFEAGQMGNLFINPLAGNVEEIMYFLQIDFLQPVYTFTFSNGLIACLVFMGIGAITDIDILLARPYMSLFLAVCAELGTILTLPIAMAMGLLPNEAAAIARNAPVSARRRPYARHVPTGADGVEETRSRARAANTVLALAPSDGGPCCRPALPS